ncbi:uncharacterized protein LOC131148278 [Malania oleifera]|uniref:uncharacterized protein LOC131148278 n=1 Tax=Malania oleifera TaxID=397392 RepID=UPI0025AE9A18|nr:uncharacterized protein LOC131148278 [Malania oleifera]
MCSDRSSAYFHAILNKNKMRRHIAAITKENGEVTTSYSQVAKEFVKFYEMLLGKKQTCSSLDPLVVDTGPVLSEARRISMTIPISDQEIRDALFSIEDGKSPGPDGYSACFFKQAWSVVGLDVISAVKEFFNNAIKTVQSHYHCPARIKPCLEEIIDPAQAAFIQKGSMVENIYMMQELIRGYARKRVSPRCLLKVDLRKAYDTIDWSFISDLLKHLKFPPMMIRWIMKCISTTTFSVSLNGRLFGFLPRNQGLTQEDPLSPLLFVLYDLMLFSRDDVVSDLEQILNIIGMRIGDYPFRYLGVPLLASRLTSSHYSPLINRISNQLKIIKVCRVFLWGGKKKPLVAWHDICLPKDEGGLGIFFLGSWNKALLSRTLWNIHSKKDSLWTKWIHHNYLKNNNIWGITAKEDSKLFKKILEIRDQLLVKSGSVGSAIELMEGWDLCSHRCYEFWREKMPRVPWRKEVWFNGSQPKHAFCLWLTLKGKLCTCDKLVGVETDQRCTYYNTKTESIDHLFFKCKFTGEVWRIIREWLGLKRSMTTIKAAVKWMHKEAKGKNIQAAGRTITLAAIVYYIWNFGNKSRFEGHSIYLLELVKVIQRHTFTTIFNKYDMLLVNMQFNG